MNMLIETTPEGTPIPGDWYHHYLTAWRQAFPDDNQTPGHYLAEIWHTPTPAWDGWFFESLGVTPPQMVTTPTNWA